jgi:hypothetical protein
MPEFSKETRRKTLFESGSLQISLFEARPHPDTCLSDWPVAVDNGGNADKKQTGSAAHGDSSSPDHVVVRRKEF